MKRAVTSVTALLAGIALAVSMAWAAEKTPSPRTPSPALVKTLLRWIAAHTDYDVSQELRHPPQIVFRSKGEVVEYEGARIVVDPRLRAAYDLPARRILLVRPWRSDDLRDVGSLLHELVHAVQWQNRRWACKQKPEWEAYKLQDEWLAEHDVASGFNWLHILQISKCYKGFHSRNEGDGRGPKQAGRAIVGCTVTAGGSPSRSPGGPLRRSGHP